MGPQHCHGVRHETSLDEVRTVICIPILYLLVQIETQSYSSLGIATPYNTDSSNIIFSALAVQHIAVNSTGPNK